MAQNGHAIPQPACDEMHTVLRCGYRISTDSKVVPSTARHNVFRVSAPSHSIDRTTFSRSGNNVSATRSRMAAGRSVMARGSAISLPKY